MSAGRPRTRRSRRTRSPWRWPCASRASAQNDLLDRLAADERLPLDRAALDALLADRLSFTGVAAAQVAAVVEQVAAVVDKYPAYEPEPIL